jgi:GNAT superfamily N-acetyltransferase
MIGVVTLATPAALPFLDRIISLKQEFWDYPAASQRRWFFENVTQGDLHVIAQDDREAIVGYTRIARKDRSSVATIDTLCVRGNAQGRGIGSMVMRAARDAILSEGRTGLLSCSPALVPFYARCGWSRAESRLPKSNEVMMQLVGATAAPPVAAKPR